jgi:hypothetical protein
MPRWRVDIIRKRAEHLGTVEAANANGAIKIAAFDIPPERQNRIAVEKVSKSRIKPSLIWPYAPKRSRGDLLLLSGFTLNVGGL